jgi:hypothetical protein
MQCKKKNVVTTQLLLMCTLGSIKLSFCGRLIAIGDTEGHHCSKLTMVSSSTSFTAKFSSKTIPVFDSGILHIWMVCRVFNFVLILMKFSLNCLWQEVHVVFQWISTIKYRYGFWAKLCSKTGTGWNHCQLAAVMSFCVPIIWNKVVVLVSFSSNPFPHYFWI